MKGQLTILKLTEVPGYIHNGVGSANWYNANKSVVYREYVAKCFHVEGLIDGRKVRFTSPTVLFTKTSGFLNHIICHDETGWFTVIDGKQTAHRGHPMFDGGNTPNVALDSHSEIVPLVKVGDVIDISYSIKSKGGALPVDVLNRVRIINHKNK